MVGFFDSGVGGKCVLKAFKNLCPEVSTVYLADTENCPYGNKTKAEIIELSDRCVKKLLAKKVSLIVIACNTATACAIKYLRSKYPEVTFVGMEPAVKPACLTTKTGTVAILATRGTFSGEDHYRLTCERYAKGVKVIAALADEFVGLVESGELEGERAENIVRGKIEPLIASGADRIVLGCTHFPHLIKLITKVVAGRAEIIDSTQAVALRIKHLLESK